MAKNQLKDLKNKDLYKLFEVQENATGKEIKKAYRKKALKLHPDKNPDDPKAAELFHELSEALKILTDIGARAAYDHVRNARKAAAERTAKLDGKRKKVKLDLEAREREAERREKESTRAATRTLEQEIERLREEGSRILQEEQLAVKKLLKKEAEERLNDLTYEPARLKVKWKLADSGHDFYTHESLMKIFSKYGHIVGLIISSKKKRGSAIVEFKSAKQAQLALDSEIGFPENPLNLSWLSGEPTDRTAYAKHFAQKLGLHEDPMKNPPRTAEPRHTEDDFSAQDDGDFEEQVFERMRKMQEMKMKQEKQEGS